MVEITRRFEAMASSCEIRACGEDEATVDRAVEAAIAEVRRIETTYSRYRPDSVVSRINAAAGSGERIEVDEETSGLLRFAAQLHADSDGQFDITSGVLRRCWDFRSGRLPSEGALKECLARVGWQHVEFDGRTIALTRDGMELDFGGFGKEYACDRAQAALRAGGIDSGFVNLGGDIRVAGPQPDGRAWCFGIQHPRRTDATVASMELPDGALATSGDYERYMEVEGRRYCHVLDPRTGWPVRHWQSVSVVAPVCVAAGALTTMAMLRGEYALEFLRDQQVSFLAVDADGRVFQESGT